VSEPLSERALQKLLGVAAASDAASPPTMPPPQVPERYRIVRELGRGGMGVVYEAHDQQLGRRCALKLIGAAAGAGDELRRRFAREALAAARLRHPHIAAVYDATPDYISMQLIDGAPIDAIDRRERRLLVGLVRDAARALQHAHEHGIVHRDLKPSNLLVEGRHLFVVDFGLAKEIAAAAAEPSLSGAVLGTPAFMPPEQAQGRTDAVSPRSDVYALGATLWHCLAGAPPFAAPDLPSLLAAVIGDEPKAPRLDRDLDTVLLKCLAKEPARRYPSAGDLADDLDRWLADQPVRARRPSLGYRLHKLLRRGRHLLQAAAAAVLLTALVLVPIALRESAARTAASEAVALSENAAAVLQDAATFAKLGDLPSGYQVLDGAIDRARDYLRRHEVAGVRHLLARLLRACDRPEEALAELQRAIADDPQLLEARFERGLLLAAHHPLGDDERRTAIADLSAEIRARSVLSSVDLLFGRAELCRLQGDLDQARELLEEVLAYDATNVAARWSLSLVAQAAGNSELAQHYAASMVDLGAGFGPVFLARERRTLPVAILGLEGALIDFAAQLGDGPDNALAYAYRGLVQLRRALRLWREDRRDDALAAVEAAVDDYEETLVVHPELPSALNNHAVCLMQAGRLHEAVGNGAAAADDRARAESDLAQALALDPSLREAHCNMGLLSLRTAALLRALGRDAAAAQRLAGARDSLQRAIDGAPADWPPLPLCRSKLAEAAAQKRAGG
jgi:tetratricopeptide (TPR) repeat protein/predicted Ser/Thr protein kinase